MESTPGKPPLEILLVDDDAELCGMMRELFGEAGFKLDCAFNGRDGLARVLKNSYDLIVLDVLLPRRDGFEVCRGLRARGNSTPILMLTARAAVDDRVSGFDAGADDYLTKPFSFREFLARVRALLRRESQLRPEVFQLDDLIVDSASHRVSRAAREIELTAKEYALLEFLARHAGQLVSRTEIAAHVWDDSFDPFSNTIEVYMNRLRKKIDDPHTIKLLHTRRGEGYILESRN